MSAGIGIQLSSLDAGRLAEIRDWNCKLLPQALLPHDDKAPGIDIRVPQYAAGVSSR
jgi:hypothetical protein